MPLPCRARFLPLAVLCWLLAGPAQADSFPSWYAKAQKAEARHDDDAALQAWSNALHLWKSTDSKPKKAQALAARAALYHKKGEWEAALKDLSGALKLKAKDAVLWHQRGVLYLEHDQASEAISDFYKATALNPGFSEAFFDRGRAYALQGDAEFSKEDFLTACHLGLQKACEKAGRTKGSAKSKGKVKPSAQAATPPSALPAVEASTPTAPTTVAASSPTAPTTVAASSPTAPTAVEAPPPKAAPPSAPKRRRTPKASAPRTAPKAAASTATAMVEIPVGSALEELPTGETTITEESSQRAAQPDFRSCINRIRACSENGENGDSYSACVARARLCEQYPKQGCCPRDCVVLFQKLLNSMSEAEAFREVFKPNSACFSIERPQSDEIQEEASP
ncbi:MAG: hypothetical protein NTY77_12935 [Elusimicrobia bacterium]|nr:hypothetical protein [Elusimicrobiota bacterium]